MAIMKEQQNEFYIRNATEQMKFSALIFILGGYL
jgi:hypothetical protein